MASQVGDDDTSWSPTEQLITCAVLSVEAVEMFAAMTTVRKAHSGMISKGYVRAPGLPGLIGGIWSFLLSALCRITVRVLSTSA